jgi:hypothetical protein
VLDASALLEWLLQTPLGARVEARLLHNEHELHVPHLVDVAVTHALRAWSAPEKSPPPAQPKRWSTSPISIRTVTPTSIFWLEPGSCVRL